MGDLECLYRYHGQNHSPDESMEIRRLSMANSSGSLVTYRDSNNREKLILSSQIASFNLKELLGDFPQRPRYLGNRAPSLPGELILADCHPDLLGRVSMPRSQIVDAVWRTTPLSIWTHLCFEI